MKRIQQLFITLFLTTMFFSLQASVFDTRYVPFLQPPYVSVFDRPSHLALDLFISTAREAYGSSDQGIPLPELYGKFDQGRLANSFVLAGKENPLRPEWRGEDISWAVSGKIQTHGLTFFWHQKIYKWISGGIYWGVMRAHGKQHFTLKPRDTSLTLLDGDELELENIRRDMFEALGLNCNHSNQVGMMDADVYLRFGHAWDYSYKFRRIDAGLKVGVLLPGGAKKDISAPAAIAFGGNGHYGIYGSLDAECELKEDWKLGLLLRASKRFKKTLSRRVPAGKEPQNFGVVVGAMEVNPGPTVVFSPYFAMENMRNGFGARIRYTLIKHTEDSWCDARACKAVPVELCEIEKRSDWAIDYVSLTAFYDFGKTSINRTFQPVVRFTWDIPTLFLVGHRVAKTHKISLGLEFNF